VLLRNLFVAPLFTAVCLRQESKSGALLDCDEFRSAQLAAQGREAMAANHPERAVSFFRQAYDTCPVERRMLLELSRAHTTEREFPEAITAAQDFLRVEPNSTPGRAEDARKWLERAVALDSNYPDALYALGQLCMRAGQKEKAAETLNRFREVKANAPNKRR
jgi:tetratricopeptide (TPR) repeat protein